jgi:UDP-N-acetylglucosamine acyltransferase
VGNHVILINYAGLTGHVIVEDRATVGGLSGVRPFARIGAFAYVGGCSKVNQDVPPFVMAVGIPATARAVNVIGMRRAGIDAASRRAVQSAFRILYRSGLAPATALPRVRGELGEHPLVAQFIAFIEASKLGIVARGRRRAPAEIEETIP